MTLFSFVLVYWVFVLNDKFSLQIRACWVCFTYLRSEKQILTFWEALVESSNLAGDSTMYIYWCIVYRQETLLFLLTWFYLWLRFSCYHHIFQTDSSTWSTWIGQNKPSPCSGREIESFFESKLLSFLFCFLCTCFSMFFCYISWWVDLGIIFL